MCADAMLADEKGDNADAIDHFVAITDLFDESVCALRVKVGGGAAAALPRDCLCPSERHRRDRAGEGPVQPSVLARPRAAGAAAALPPPLLPLVDALTRDDARLFVAGLAAAAPRARRRQRAVRGRLVCDAKLHALRAELAYLPGAAAALDEFEAIR